MRNDYGLIVGCFFSVQSIDRLTTTLLAQHMYICVMQLRSGEDPRLQNTLENASYQGGRAAN